MNHMNRKLAIAAIASLISFAAIPAQADMYTSVAGRIVSAAGDYFTAQGSETLRLLRQQLSNGIEPHIQRLPSITVRPTAEEMREAGFDPSKPRQHAAGSKNDR